MTRLHLLDKLKTVGVVLLVSVLVWLFAEGAVVQQETMTLRIRILPPPGEQVAIEPGGTVSVQVAFRGSSAGMQRVAEAIRGTPFQVPLPPGLIGGGEESLTLEAVLMRETPLGELGVTIIETEPRTLLVRAIPLVTRVMKLEVDTAGLGLSEAAKLSVPEVQITLPEVLAARLDDRPLRVSLAAFADDNLPVGQPLSREVRLTIPTDLKTAWTTLGREEVTVLFRLRERRVPLALENVPIYLNIPPSLLDRYRVRLPGNQETLVEAVSLSGPAAIIGRLREGQARVRAQVTPTAEELEAIVTGEREPLLRISLNTPPGVEVVSEVPPVRVEVQRVEVQRIEPDDGVTPESVIPPPAIEQEPRTQ